MGEATPIQAVRRFTTPNSSGDVSNGPLLLLFFNDTSGPAICNTYKTADRTPDQAPIQTRFSAIQFQDVPHNTPFIPIRQSIRITNITEVIHRGGIVRVLRMNNLDPKFRGHVSSHYTVSTHPSTVITAEVNELCEMIRDSPKTRSFGAAELGQPRQWNSYVTDLTGSSTFADRTLSSVSEPNMKFTSDIANAQPMSCIAMLIEAHSVESNSFEITVMSQRLYRFPYGTILASFAISVPYIEQHIAHQLKASEEHPEHNLGRSIQNALPASKFKRGAMGFGAGLAAYTAGRWLPSLPALAAGAETGAELGSYVPLLAALGAPAGV
jgi:hypothetical protein